MSQHDKYDAEVAAALDRLGAVAEEERPETLAAPASLGPADLAVKPAPEDVDVSIDDLDDWYAVLVQAKLAQRKAKETEDEAREIIVKALEAQHGPPTDGKVYGTIGGRRVLRYAHLTSQRFDTRAFRAAHPDLAEQFTRESEYERLDIL